MVEHALFHYDFRWVIWFALSFGPLNYNLFILNNITSFSLDGWVVNLFTALL